MATSLLGVECDGATYKSSSSARDRDRLREQVLRQLGWRIHRIWSPAWVARRDSEIRRLKETLEQAQKTQLEKDAQKPIIDIKENSAPKTDVQKNTLCRYRKNRCTLQSLPAKSNLQPLHQSRNSQNHIDSKQKNEFHFPENRENQTKLLAELIQNEGPVHFDYAVERLAAAWGIKQVTPKISHAVKEALNNLITRTESCYQRQFPVANWT